MKKRMFAVLTVLCLLAALSMPVFAVDSAAVIDYADLLTEAEEQQLAAVAEQIAGDYDCGVYIATVIDYNAYGDTPYDAAVELYIQQTMMGDVPKDGILLMLSMADRDYSLITYGEYAEAVFTDSVMWEMEEDFLAYFGMNSWYNGFACYVSAAGNKLIGFEREMTGRYGEKYVSYYDPGVPNIVVRFNSIDPALWGAVLLGSMAVALVVCLIMKAGMRTARRATNANAYIPAGGVTLRVNKDRFTHTTTRVIHHPKPSSSGSSGGGFRGHSGKF